MTDGGFADSVRRLVFQRSPARRQCSHLELVAWTEAGGRSECRRCAEEGTRTVHLRMCLICGEAACCDSSPAKHARQHYEETGHPLIRSIEPGEAWAWCYPESVYLTGVQTTNL